MHLGVLEHVVDRIGHRPPSRLFDPELATSGGRDFIGPRAPVVFGHDGSCFDPTRFFHSMKARIQRALLDPQGVRKAVNV